MADIYQPLQTAPEADRRDMPQFSSQKKACEKSESQLLSPLASPLIPMSASIRTQIIPNMDKVTA
jgi:hypothetical protein